MKEKVLLIGSGGLSRVAMELASINYDCSFVDDRFKIGDRVCNTEVVDHITDLKDLHKSFDKLVVTIGNN